MAVGGIEFLWYVAMRDRHSVRYTAQNAINYVFIFQPRFVLSIIISVGSIIKNRKRWNRLSACVCICLLHKQLVWFEVILSIASWFTIYGSTCTTGQSVWPMNDDDKCCNNESTYIVLLLMKLKQQKKKKMKWSEMRQPQPHPFINVACINRHIDKRIRCHFNCVQSASSTNNWEREFIELCVVN